ncbi:UDP-glycosyltransferase 89B2-like isoform X2 [Arachis ipaensis]|uniref:UDP-glycosyltransferase 89B2-like isoform X2 n=1 Tax=Arachis ipaensis TaxID=130454 RepID=UPI000A2B50E9|nr:UDP-glycosyltransferase 89B2-like isoform X2 [Arachis ipaensis]
MADESKNLHIVMFPFLAFGHILPFYELAKLIAQKGHKISFISTPRNIKRLPKPPLNLQPFLELIELPLPQVENLPQNAESTMDIPHHMVPYLKKAFDGLEEPLRVTDAFRIQESIRGAAAIFIRSCMEVEGEQELNSMVVEGMKVGVKVERNEGDGKFTRYSIAKALRTMMFQEEGKSCKRHAEEKKNKIFGSMEIQQKYIDDFVDYMQIHRPIKNN